MNLMKFDFNKENENTKKGEKRKKSYETKLNRLFQALPEGILRISVKPGTSPFFKKIPHIVNLVFW